MVARSAGRTAAAVEALFAGAGIAIGGGAPHDIVVHDPRFFAAVLGHGELGLGEAYMAGWWDCKRIDEMTTRFITSGLLDRSYRNVHVLFYHLAIRLSGLGSPRRAFEVGRHHYDLGNNLFSAMLDRRLIYSCAEWADTDTLEQAQERKLDLICRKLGLRPGMRLLDIGCGWGGFARFVAEHYEVSVVGVTVSREQADWARANVEGLPVDIRLADYRSLNERFDRITSIAMFESVGHHYYRVFMKVVDRCLADDGRFLLHSIVANEPVGPSRARFLNEYIFPNGETPSLAQITKASEGLFTVEALQRLDGYDRTLEAWYQRFVAAWPSLAPTYDQRFYRMWVFYLQISRGIFRSRLAHVWHIIFSKQRPGRVPVPAFLPSSEIEAR